MYYDTQHAHVFKQKTATLAVVGRSDGVWRTSLHFWNDVSACQLSLGPSAKDRYHQRNPTTVATPT